MRLLSIFLGGLLFSIIEVVSRLYGYMMGGILTVIVFVLCQLATDRLIYKQWKSHKLKKEMELLHPNYNSKDVQ